MVWKMAKAKAVVTASVPGKLTVAMARLTPTFADARGKSHRHPLAFTAAAKQPSATDADQGQRQHSRISGRIDRQKQRELDGDDHLAPR